MFLVVCRSLVAGQGWNGKNEVVWSDSQFSGYSVGIVSPYGSQVLALGNITGAVKLLKLERNGGWVV
jgi:hypothetical protein